MTDLSNSNSIEKHKFVKECLNTCVELNLKCSEYQNNNSVSENVKIKLKLVVKKQKSILQKIRCEYLELFGKKLFL